MTHTVRLPEGWVEVPIEDVLVRLEDGRLIHQGWSPQCEKGPSQSDDAWGVLKTTAIQDGEFQPEHNKLLPSEMEPRPLIEVHEGDILLTCAGPRARCGVPCLVRVTRPRLMLSGKMYRFRTSEEHFSTRYLESFLRSKDTQIAIDRMKTGISDSGLNLTQKRFRQLTVPVAPRPEQERIIEVLESYLTRLDGAVASLERVQHNLERYRASVLKAAVKGRLVPTEAELARKEGRSYEPASELLNRILDERRKKWIENAAEKARAKAEEKARKAGQSWIHADDVKTLEKERAKAVKKYKEPAAPDTTDLPDLPEGWCWATIESLLREPLRNGHSAKATSDPDGIRTLTLTAVTEGDFSTQNTKITSADPQKVANLWLEPGDLLVERSNTVELVGTTALFDGPSGFAIFPDLMIRVRLLDGILARWIENVLRSQRVRTHFQLTAQGIAGTMPKISQGVVGTLPVPVPPWAEQHRIVDALDLHELPTGRIAAESARAIARSRSLRQSILKWAFEGKLVEHDPDDEPASVLLERIKAEREAMEPRKKRRSNKKKNEPTKHDEQLDLLGGRDR